MLNWRNQAISLFDRYRHLPVELGRIHFAAGIHPPSQCLFAPAPASQSDRHRSDLRSSEILGLTGRAFRVQNPSL